MNANPLLQLKTLGQHVWLDNLSRTIIEDGTLQALMGQDGMDGVTSNPVILQKAIAGSPLYRADLERLRASTLDAEARYESLVIPDIRAACDIMAPAFVASDGETGYVSLEVSPALAHDRAGTVAAAQRLRQAVERDNLLIKVPATPAGILAFEQLTAAGVAVNVTLIFSLAQYDTVVQAYLRGARRWLDAGGEGRRLRSVASVFLSRVDTLVDQRLEALAKPQALALRGQAAVALGRRCYRRYLDIFHGAAFASLGEAGVRPQTPLWASTGTKNPAYSDVLYVESLIGAETINTLPDATMAAFRDHGQAVTTLTADTNGSKAHGENLAQLGIDLVAIGEILQGEGVKSFAAAYDSLLAAVQAQ